MEQKPLKDFIIESAEAKGLNLEKLYFLTGVPKHYLDAIFRADWKKLPAAPYARGYFKKLESVLGLANDQLWQIYKEEIEPRTSGPTDRLPDNRFAIKVKRRWSVWLGLLILLGGVYVAWNFDRFLGIPNIEVTDPLSATMISLFPDYTLIGDIDPQDKLYINSEEVYVDQNGRFEKSFRLTPGMNNFELLVKRFLGQETKVAKQIIYRIEEDGKQ